TTMKNSQLEKLALITESTLIVGVDIAKKTHYAQCCDYRGVKLHKAFPFQNTKAGIDCLLAKLYEVQEKHDKSTIIVAMEPTGHYWENLATTLKNQGILVTLVSSLHVHQSKELDDNSPAKTDPKDAGVIASLVKDGRFSIPNMPEGIYADIRNLVRFRDQIVQEQIRYKLRLQTLMDRYFPERAGIFKEITGKASLAILKQYPFPSDINGAAEEALAKVMAEATHNKVGKSKAAQLIQVARHSIGITEGLASARLQATSLVQMLELLASESTKIEDRIKELLSQISYAKPILTIPCIGPVLAAVIVSEIGDIDRFSNWKQLRKLAGLNLKENSSGTHKGKTRITKRGRSRLRSALYRAALIAIAKVPEFRALHDYFTTRTSNQLAGKQSVIAICCKLLRIIFSLAKKGGSYQPELALGEYRWQQLGLAA
ncbi:MAG: IS110 family transposase, partial [Peptococcaceae bacterium]|nr:IS110 family transposase [Peptococcaceae bacterium]